MLSSKTVLQFKDVDHYFGTTIEPDLIDFLNFSKMSVQERLKKSKRFREANGGRIYQSWQVVESLLRPYCDSIWNAVGFPRSEYFDPSGKWLGQVYRPDRP